VGATQIKGAVVADKNMVSEGGFDYDKWEKE